MLPAALMKCSDFPICLGARDGTHGENGRAQKWFHIYGTFVCWLRSLRMSDRANTKIIGLSLSGILFAMLLLNALVG